MGIKVLEDKCTGCGLCLKSCLYQAINIKNKVAVINDSCILCGACVPACKFQAIQLTTKESIKDFPDYRGFMVFLETKDGRIKDSGLELLSKTRQLNKILNTNICGVCMGASQDQLHLPFKFGADKVFAFNSDGWEQGMDDTYSQALFQIIGEVKPEIFLAAATSFGRTLTPKLAAMLKTGLTADCTELEVDKDTRLLKQTRPTFGGNVLATIVCKNSRPQMATVRPHVFKKVELGAKPEQIEMVPLKKAGLVNRQKLLDVDHNLDQDINLADYEVIVAGGRGMGGSQNFSLLRELADLLKGTVAASRAAVDAGWIAYPHQVGQTGKTVNPKLYIACGISGAIQHLAGMQTSDIIIAINKDSSAPIFKVANYGIVGDILEIVPKLISRIKQGLSLVD